MDHSPSHRWWGKETIGIVTGANRGIGYELAKRLAESGITVILTARDEIKGQQSVEKLKTQLKVGANNNVHFGLLDVSQPHSIRAFVAWFKNNFGVLDILVNNAAVSFNNVDENSVEHAETVINTNFYGPKYLIEELLPLFGRSSNFKSRILNLSSRLGLLNKVRNPKVRSILEDEETLSEEKIEEVTRLFLKHVKEGTWETQGWPDTWTDYAVSKLALNAYSRLLATRLRDQNIIVNCFCPGFTQTGMTSGKGTRTPRLAAQIGANIALLHPSRLQTGKFTMGQSLFLYSRF